MKTTLFFAATILIATLISTTVVDSQLNQDQGTLLVVESPNLFVVSPAGGALRKVPLAKPIISVGGISGTRQIVVATRDEQGTPVVEKLLLPGEVLGRYPKPPYSFPSSFSPDGMFLLYQNIVEGTLILHDIEKNVGRKLFDVDKWERVLHPVMSPNGTLVAFSLFITGSPSVISRVCLLHVDEPFHRDRCIGERAMLPAFSFDGTQLAYWEQTKSAPNPTWSIVVRKVSETGDWGGSNTVVSRDFPGMYEDRRIGRIGWSPDSKWLVWAVQKEHFSPFSELFRTQIDTGDTHNVPISRSWWTEFWREYVLPTDKNRIAFDFQWIPFPLEEYSEIRR